MLKIHNEKETMTAFLSGELDHHSCAVMRKAIDLKTEQERPQVLVLDFSGVQFMDSSGIGLVMGRYRQMSLLGGKLSVVNVPSHLEKIMRLSGLGTLGVMK
ncbi:MAG: anti-sigma factor antagonist [Eubacteriales bacterium]|nr:anti-sigma factor antagonist [Eubacteriales bacterium]